MSKREIQILPPVRTEIAKPAVITSNVPAINTGGRIESALSKWRWEYQSRAVDALARLNASEAACRARQTELVEQDIRFREALVRHQELPERLGHELAVRRVHRANEYREAQHRYEIDEMRRVKEVTLAEADYTHAKAALRHAQTVLTDAEQQLSAQRKHGELNYELAHAKKNLELLDVELSAEERRALMRKQLGEIEGPEGEDDRYYRERAEALADGDDSAIEEEVDALFEKARRRPK